LHSGRQKPCDGLTGPGGGGGALSSERGLEQPGRGGGGRSPLNPPPSVISAKRERLRE